MAKVPNKTILDKIVESARAKRGARPEGYHDNMRPGSPKYVDEELVFKAPSSNPGNVELFREKGKSRKMMTPNRIYANQWYADPKNKIEQGYDPSMSDAEFKKAFIARLGVPTIEQREMAQRAYDKKVGRDVAREYARYVNQNNGERYGYEYPYVDISSKMGREEIKWRKLYNEYVEENARYADQFPLMTYDEFVNRAKNYSIDDEIAEMHYRNENDAYLDN